MSTPFSNIYKFFLNAISDNVYIGSLPTYQYYSDMFVYLEDAVATFRLSCYQDLTSYTAYSSTTYSLTGNGGATYTLSPTPPTDETETCILVEGVETTAFSRDDAEITFDADIGSGEDITVVTFKIGEFGATLSLTEQKILSQIMVIPFLQQQLHDVEKMITSQFNPDFKVFSPAEKLKEIRNNLKTQEEYVESLIIKYTFSDNPDSLKGFFGGYSNG